MTTEKSADDAVLDDVFSSSRDRGADLAAPKAEPDIQAPDPLAETPSEPGSTEQPAEAKPKGYKDPENGRFVSHGALHEERERRKEALKARDEEARLRQQAEENAQRYQRELAEMQRRFQAQAQPPPPPPDPLMDPEGAYSHMMQTFNRQLENQRVDFSEARARDKFGDEAVDKAVQASIQAGVNMHFVKAPDPYGALLKWHHRQQNLQRVGDDVDAFEKRIREEERNKTMEELRAGRVSVMPGQTPQQPQRFPGSLVDATASGPQGAQPVSDEAMMASVFSTDRKRRL